MGARWQSEEVLGSQIWYWRENFGITKRTSPYSAWFCSPTWVFSPLTKKPLTVSLSPPSTFKAKKTFLTLFPRNIPHVLLPHSHHPSATIPTVMKSRAIFFHYCRSQVVAFESSEPHQPSCCEHTIQEYFEDELLILYTTHANDLCARRVLDG